MVWLDFGTYNFKHQLQSLKIIHHTHIIAMFVSLINISTLEEMRISLNICLVLDTKEKSMYGKYF